MAGREAGVARQQIEVIRTQLNRFREIFDEKAILERHHQLIAHWEQLYPAMREIYPAQAEQSYNEAFFEKAEKEGGIHLLSVQWWEEADARYRSEGAMFYSRRRVTMLDELWPGIDWQSLFSLVE